jgi:hypothetical protein
MPALASTRDFEASLLEGEQLFFEAQPLAAQKQPNCIVGDLEPARGELVLESVKRQCGVWLVRSLIKARYGSRTGGLAMSTHLDGRYRPVAR